MRLPSNVSDIRCPLHPTRAFVTDVAYVYFVINNLLGVTSLLNYRPINSPFTFIDPNLTFCASCIIHGVTDIDCLQWDCSAFGDFRRFRNWVSLLIVKPGLRWFTTIQRYLLWATIRWFAGFLKAILSRSRMIQQKEKITDNFYIE
jgi:hypothetical protein